MGVTFLGPFLARNRHHLTVRHEVLSPKKLLRAKPTQSYPPPCESQIILTFQIPFLTKKRHQTNSLKKNIYKQIQKSNKSLDWNQKYGIWEIKKLFPQTFVNWKKKQASVPESDPTTCCAGPKNGPMDRPRNKVTRGFIFRWKNINHLVFQLPTIPIFPGDDAYELVDLRWPHRCDPHCCCRNHLTLSGVMTYSRLGHGKGRLFFCVRPKQTGLVQKNNQSTKTYHQIYAF